MTKTLLHNWRKIAFLDSKISRPELSTNPFSHDCAAAIAALTEVRTSFVPSSNKSDDASPSCWMASKYWSEQSERAWSMTGSKVLLRSRVLMYCDVSVAFEDARVNAIMPSCFKSACLLSGLDSKTATQLFLLWVRAHTLSIRLVSALATDARRERVRLRVKENRTKLVMGFIFFPQFCSRGC